MIKDKSRLLGKQVWCQTCVDKRPPRIKVAEFLIPLREKPYDLHPNGVDIDRRLSGVCAECLACKGKFQQDSAQAVDINHGHFVYKAG